MGLLPPIMKDILNLKENPFCSLKSGITVTNAISWNLSPEEVKQIHYRNREHTLKNYKKFTKSRAHLNSVIHF